MKETKNKEAVARYIEELSHPLAEVVEVLRKIILNSGKEIGEQIKWNSLSFFYTGEMKASDPKEYKRDILVVNLLKKEYILLVFPTGAKVKDTTGLFEGNYTDGRSIAKIMNMDDAKSKEKALQSVIDGWLKLVDR